MRKIIIFSVVGMMLIGLFHPASALNLSPPKSNYALLSQYQSDSPYPTANLDSTISIEDVITETVQNIAIQGYIPAKANGESNLTINIATKPQKGSVTFDGLTFFYHPYKDMTGADQFTVRAVDPAGNVSREAVITIYIDKSGSDFNYLDMTGNPSAYAASMLRQQGVFTGTKIGDAYLYQPERFMTRGDFLVLLITAAGLDEELRPTVNTGLPNDVEIPGWLKAYVRIGIESGILSAIAPFEYTEIPTRAEAVVLTDRASRIHDVKDYNLSLPDSNEIPDWALSSYKDLAAYKMLDLYEGYAYPFNGLTNSYAADLSWQLYKHKHR